MRILIHDDPLATPASAGWYRRGEWPASWIDHPTRSQTAPSVAAFRLSCTAGEETVVRIHVSADNRYRLFLDGQLVGLGPERGDPAHWRFESYDLTLTPGAHTLVAQTWWLGEALTPHAQMSFRPGFLLAAEGAWQERLSTGLASWEAMLLEGLTFLPPGYAWGTGARVRIDGAAYPWGWETGAAGPWEAAVPIIKGMAAGVKNEAPPCWMLTPATLPAMRMEERCLGRVRYLVTGEDAYPVDLTRHQAEAVAAWEHWLAGTAPLTIPAGQAMTAVIDLEDYYCAYPALTVSGGMGAAVRLHWAEALFEHAQDDWHKGQRDEIAGKYFRGVGSELLPDGGAQRTLAPCWWEAGRYVELRITTAEAPLTLERLTFTETGYPLEQASTFDASDARLAPVIPLALRTLRMCAHETYMDCPYYEQLMYVGDTRLEVLATYAVTQDDRLPRKALLAFDHSRRLNGFTTSRFPSKLTQVIPPFSLWWVCMVHDYWQWRDDMAFVRERLPALRAVMEGFRQCFRPDGLMGVPNGWNFVDWVPTWAGGVPPGAEEGPSSILNLQCALALSGKAEMERYFGEPELALRDLAAARRLVEEVVGEFWQEERGLLADDQAGEHFSEHAQCLALLTGMLPDAIAARVAAGLLGDPALARTTIYFTHYLFETYYRLGVPERMLERMGLWFTLRDGGFRTTLEMPEPSRSDCHAWGAHPVYHYYASLLGIRPEGPGFRRVRIAPQLGPLGWAEGTLPHPAGALAVRVARAGEGVQAAITLPGALSGTFVWGGERVRLDPGENQVALATAPA